MQAEAASRSFGGTAINTNLSDKVAELEIAHGSPLDTAGQVRDVITALRETGGLEKARTTLRDLIARIGDRLQPHSR